MKLLTVSGAGRRDNPLIKARSAVDLFTYEMAGVARREREVDGGTKTRLI